MSSYYLFEFEVALNRYYYTSYSSDIDKYKSVVIYPGELGKDSMSDDANIVCAFDIAPVELYKKFNPSVSVKLRVLDESKTLLFYGRVSDVTFNLANGTANIKLSTLGGVMKGKIPTRTYSRECGFELFDKNCSLNKENFSLTLLGNECEFENTTIISPKISTKPIGYFNAGFVAFDNQYSYIVSSSKDRVNMMFPLSGLSSSSVLRLYAGCDKLLKTCRDKFNNEVSYGGFAFVPSKNPMREGF